jgi:hypothetical protein
MLTASTTLNAAAAAAARQVAAMVAMDFGRTGTFTDYTEFATSWEFTRTVTTDVPTGSRYVAGYSAAQLDLAVMGNKYDNAQDGAWYWSAYNPASPVYNTKRVGTPVRVSAGFVTTAGTELLPRFTGTIRALEVDSATRSAQLTVADGSEKMRAKTVLPMIVGALTPRAGTVFDPILQNLYSTSVLDLLFRQNGYYCSPKPRSHCILSVPAHGSMEPDYITNSAGRQTHYGTTQAAWTGADRSTGGRLLMRYTTSPAQSHFSQCPDPTGAGMYAEWIPRKLSDQKIWEVGSGDTFVVEAWVDLTNRYGVAGGDSLWGVCLRFQSAGGVSYAVVVGFTANGQPFLSFDRAGTTQYGTAVTVGITDVYMKCDITFSAASLTAEFTLNGSPPGAGRTLTSAFAYPGPLDLIYISVGSNDVALNRTGPGTRARWEALQVTYNEPTPSPSNYTFEPTAVLEPSLNRLTVVPYITDTRDTWATVQDIAAQEFGLVFFDELGMARFWNRKHITGQTAALYTLTASRLIANLTATESLDSVTNKATATLSPWTLSDGSWVYKLGSTVGIHSRSTYSFKANFDTLAGAIGTECFYIPLGGFPAGQEVNGYRACRTPPGGDGDAVSNLDITISPSQQSAVITVHNPNPYPVYLIGPVFDTDGTTQFPPQSRDVPMLQLWGRTITQSLKPTGTSDTADTVTTVTLQSDDPASIKQYGEQPFDMGTSEWQQNALEVQATLDDIVAQCAYPHPVLGDVEVVSDPRVQLGDRVALQDPTGLHMTTDAFIVGITEAGDSAGHRQTLTLKAYGGANAWVLGDPVRGQLDDGYVLGGAY